jgi:mannosyltransferase
MRKRLNYYIGLIEQKPILEYSFLAIITLVATILRLYKLGEWSFWGDEVFSLGSKSDGFVQSTTVSLIHLTTGLLGTNEWSARYVPGLIGIISVPLIYFPLKRISGIRVGLLAAILLAISTWHIYWSQNARFYILLLLLYTFGLLTFYIGLEENRPWFILSSLIFFGFAAKERLLALMFIPVIAGYLIAIYFMRFEKPAGYRWRNIVMFFAPGLLIFGVFATPFFKDIAGWFAAFGRINNNPFWLIAGSFYYITLPIIFLSAFGGIYFILKKNHQALFFGMGAIIPLIVIVAWSLIQYTANRYMFVSLTSWLILAAMTINEMFILMKGSSKILAVGILLLVLGISFSEDILYFRYQLGNRDNWKAAFEYVSHHKEVDDLIVAGNPEVGNFYLQDQVIGFQQFAQAEINDDQQIWFVEDMNVKELFPQHHNWLSNNTQLVAEFDNHVNARVFLMRVYFYDAVE